MYVCVLVSCCAQRGSAPRKTLALHWLGSVCVSVRVWRWERGSNEGVKIPYHSKINHLSYGLTFTEGLNRGSLWGGCPASVFSSCRVCTRFPSTREKSSIDISGCFCPLCRVWTRVRRKLGFSTGIQLCVFACFPCLHRNVWRGCFMCNWGGKSVFILQSFSREFRRMLLCRPGVGGGCSHSDRT